jgi:squalene-associated FAD-dependent desaturase
MTTLIIGAGWSGLAAAVKLTEMGETVHILESAKQLGGRARNVAWHDLDVDNGQHLMIGAYRQTLALLKTVGADESALFQRKALNLAIHHPHYPVLHINAGNGLPWPLSIAWHLWRDNDFAVFKQISSVLPPALKLQTKPDMSVQDWLKQQSQSDRLIAQLWEPLCLAMLNTPINEASARVFTYVLIETFKKRGNTDLLLPTKSLGDSLPLHAAAFIRAHGGKISLQTRVKSLKIKQGHINGVLTSDDEFIAADKVIIATSPAATKTLLSEHSSLYEPGSYPIATVYLQFNPAFRLKQPIIGLSGTISQWLFDRHELKPGLVAVVISGPGEHQKLDKTELAEGVFEELQQLVPEMPENYEDSLVIREKRATFACSVDIEKQRPNNRTEITGLWLAGDYVSNGYPATLEGAVINGQQTATELMEHHYSSR